MISGKKWRAGWGGAGLPSGHVRVCVCQRLELGLEPEVEGQDRIPGCRMTLWKAGPLHGAGEGTLAWKLKYQAWVQLVTQKEAV